MRLEDLKKELETQNKIYRGICHDCGKQVEVSVKVTEKGKIEISGGALYRVKQQYNEEELYLKCDVCYDKDRILHNFRECEIFSRVVGYYRPVSQWNKGKAAEWGKRKTFKVG